MPAAPEQSEQARPGVLKRGWLFKEGAHTLSRAFPSRRFCIVVDGRLEYYEERQVLLRLLPDGSTGVSLNKWNLVLHEQNDGQGVLVGDIITKVNGMDLGLQMLNDVVSSAPPRRRAGAHRAEPFKLTVMRPKGEVPLVGAALLRIGRDRLQVTPSPRGVVDSRPPYGFIADGESDRNEWHAAIEQCAMQQQEPPPPPPPPPPLPPPPPPPLSLHVPQPVPIGFDSTAERRTSIIEDRPS